MNTEDLQLMKAILELCRQMGVAQLKLPDGTEILLFKQEAPVTREALPVSSLRDNIELSVEDEADQLLFGRSLKSR